MKVHPVFLADLDQKLQVRDKPKFNMHLKRLGKGEVEVVVRKPKRQRSNNQNRYYWGVVLEIISQEKGEIDKNALHGLLGTMFLKAGVDFRGKRYERIRSTTELSTREFEDYLEKVRTWAGQDLGIYVPLPNEIDLTNLLSY